MVNQPIKKLNIEPKTSRYQIMASMTPEELLSEGYATYDDFYDPQEEEWKKAVEIMERISRETKFNEDELVEF
ncbi:MAG: hypothetical protein HC908_01530 [Calothrix sp. SM1_7_51]|nr:hypothetical protein [Calothrix sp. SM1_7_51]